MSYEIYKQFGRVISKEESDLIIAKVFASWWELPFINFKIWLCKIKRWNSAEIKLKGDNPWRFW